MSADSLYSAATRRIAELASRRELRLVAAESLTSGQVASAIGAAPGASEWFRGGVVAYANEVKYETLGVSPGPVITADCARQMATGVLNLLGGDTSVAVTGVGGPEPIEGKPAGTVFIATALRREADDAITVTTEHHFPGAPDAVLAATVRTALHELLRRLEDEDEPSSQAPPASSC